MTKLKAIIIVLMLILLSSCTSRATGKPYQFEIYHYVPERYRETPCTHHYHHEGRHGNHRNSH